MKTILEWLAPNRVEKAWHLVKTDGCIVAHIQPRNRDGYYRYTVETRTLNGDLVPLTWGLVRTVARAKHEAERHISRYTKIEIVGGAVRMLAGASADDAKAADKPATMNDLNFLEALFNANGPADKWGWVEVIAGRYCVRTNGVAWTAHDVYTRRRVGIRKAREGFKLGSVEPIDYSLPQGASAAAKNASTAKKSAGLKAKFATREEWLIAVAERMAPRFEEYGKPLPKVRMAIGFTSKGMKAKRIGECWSDETSGDKTHEIFIVPTLDDSMRVADILCHELVHAAVGIKEGHNKKSFGVLARKLGLEGKLTATVGGPEFVKWAGPIVKALGPIPHSAITGGLSSGPKKQTARMLKCECPECGYTVRTTRKWLESAGAPICPTDGVSMQSPDMDDSEDDDNDSGGLRE